MMHHDDNSRHSKKSNFETGDVIFVKGKNGVLDTLIRFLTRSSFIHAAILVEIRGLWFIIETRKSSYYGYQIMPLEWWLTRNHDNEMYLGKMPSRNSRITSNIRRTLMSSAECTRPYKISWIFLTYILQVWLGVFRPNLSKLYNGSKPLICSTLIQEAWERAGVIEPSNYMTPADLVDCIGGETNLLPLQDKHDNENPQHPLYGNLTAAQ